MVHQFLFQPGEWLGTGQVRFSMSPDVLHFRMKWVIARDDISRLHCSQIVEIVGGDRIINDFVVTPFGESSFDIVLENDLLGTFVGSGLFEKELIAWEFREKGAFEGFEVYKYLNETEYTMHAEYLSSDQMRTMIRGKIWKKTGSFM